MPRLIDHEERAKTIADASLRVLVRDGLGNVSVRKVADEAQIATASLRRAFPSQAALREYCFDAIRQRVAQRMRMVPGEGISLARGLLIELLPLDDERRTELIAQLQLGALALTDPTLRPMSADLTRGVREVCRAVIGELARTNELRRDQDVEATVDRLHIAVDGIALQALLDPALYDQARTLTRLDRLLAEITHTTH